MKKERVIDRNKQNLQVKIKQNKKKSKQKFLIYLKFFKLREIRDKQEKIGIDLAKSNKTKQKIFSLV